MESIRIDGRGPHTSRHHRHHRQQPTFRAGPQTCRHYHLQQLTLRALTSCHQCQLLNQHSHPFGGRIQV
ncbi:unnamed protein product [Gadus morhua 'NCC']